MVRFLESQGWSTAPSAMVRSGLNSEHWSAACRFWRFHPPVFVHHPTDVDFQGRVRCEWSHNHALQVFVIIHFLWIFIPKRVDLDLNTQPQTTTRLSQGSGSLIHWYLGCLLRYSVSFSWYLWSGIYFLNILANFLVNINNIYKFKDINFDLGEML